MDRQHRDSMAKRIKGTSYTGGRANFTSNGRSSHRSKEVKLGNSVHNRSAEESHIDINGKNEPVSRSRQWSNSLLKLIEQLRLKSIAVLEKIRPVVWEPKKIRYSGLAATLVIVVSFFTFTQFSKPDKTTTKDTKAVLGSSQEKPSFKYILPAGRADKLEGGVKYDPNKGVVGFRDAIGSVAITVSQQRLPEGFSEDTQNKVKRLAEDFSAKEVISTSSPTAFLGTSSKGPQTVIFAKNGVLVFLQSTKPIDTHDWAEYITALK